MLNIKPGIMLSITSWENDGDNYNTKTLYGLCEDEAKFWLGLAKLCGGRKYANMPEHRHIDEIGLGEEFRALVNKHHSGFAVTTDGWDVSSLYETPDENENDPVVGLIQELVYDVLGSSELCSFRVYESYKAYLIPSEIVALNLE